MGIGKRREEEVSHAKSTERCSPIWASFTHSIHFTQFVTCIGMTGAGRREPRSLQPARQQKQPPSPPICPASQAL